MAQEWRLGDEDLSFAEYNDHTMDALRLMWMRNVARNYHELLNYKSLKELVGKHRGSPVLVVGSGPGLDDVAPQLKDFPGIVLSGDSALSACLKNGCRPDYVVSLDGGTDGAGRFDGVPVKGLKLITNTSIDPGVIDVWKNEDIYVHSLHDAKSTFFNTDVLSVYPDFPSIQNIGCVAGTMLIIAVLLGCSPVYAVGLDMGFTGGKYRHQGYKMVDGKWVPTPIDHKKKIGDSRTLSQVNGVLCRQVDRFYREAILGLYNQIASQGVWYFSNEDEKIMQMILPGSKGTPIVNCTGGGILREIPRAHFSDILKYHTEKVEG